jgi:hypothetical protein
VLSCDIGIVIFPTVDAESTNEQHCHKRYNKYFKIVTNISLTERNTRSRLGGPWPLPVTPARLLVVAVRTNSWNESNARALRNILSKAQPAVGFGREVPGSSVHLVAGQQRPGADITPCFARCPRTPLQWHPSMVGTVQVMKANLDRSRESWSGAGSLRQQQRLGKWRSRKRPRRRFLCMLSGSTARLVRAP